MRLGNPLLKAIRSDLTFSRAIPFTHLNDATIFETGQGMIGSVIRLAGIPFDTERNDVLNEHQSAWQHAIQSLSEHFALYVTLHRHTVSPVLTGEFRSPFLAKLDKEYHAKFQSKTLYQNTLYLTVLYKGITSGKSGKFLRIFTRAGEKALKNIRAHNRQVQCEQLEQTRKQLMNGLHAFSPCLVGSQDEALGYSELLSTLSLIINGGEQIKLLSPQHGAVPFIETDKNVNESLHYPQGNLAQYLPTKRLFFGKAIQFDGGTPTSQRFAAMLTIKRYPAKSFALMLDPLLHVDSEYIATHTFSIEPLDIALDRIDKQENQLASVGDAAVSQQQALTILKDKLASGEEVMGYHHHTLMVMADNLSELDKKVSQVTQCYSEAGMMVIVETLGKESAFFAQIPGNFRYRARTALVTSSNFVDFCPLHNYRTGYRDDNHLGGALTLFETPAKTPYFMNYHQRGHGNRQFKTNGHTLIVGTTGSGKTNLMAFLDGQASRYQGRTFIFDRKQGLELYVRACGGYYTVLSPNHHDVQFNPFSLSDTPNNRHFCTRWLAQLIRTEEGEIISPSVLEDIKRCVDYAYNHLAPGYRYLSNAVRLLPIDFPYWPHLRRWMAASEVHEAGEYAYLFDHPIDTFVMQDTMGFDMTYFLGTEESAAARNALFMYITYRLEESMDGSRLLSIYLDEGWQYFQDEFWKKKVEAYFASIRSKNGHLVLATQTPKTVIESSIHPVIMANVATQIFFPHPAADRNDYTEGFKLTEQEYEAVRDTDPRTRLFLVKQQNESVLCRLDLSSMPEALSVLSSNEDAIRRAAHLRSVLGESPEQWLPAFYEGLS